MSLSREDAAQKLGMKVEEIRDIRREGGEYVVTTHDGVETRVEGDELVTETPRGDIVAEAGTAGEGPEVVADLRGDGQPGVVTEAMAQAPAGEQRADTPPRDPALDGGDVPDGGAADVINWVGSDQQRARRALDVERGREKPRSTLIATLEKLKG